MLYLYLTMLTLSLLLGYFVKSKPKYFWIMYTLFAITVGLRGTDVGSDTANYARIYSVFTPDPIWDIIYYMEFGTRVEMWLGNVIFNDVQGFLFITAIFTYAPLAIFIFRISGERYYWLATFLVVALGFYSYSFNALRQATAVAISCNAFYYLIKGKNIKGFLLLTLSVLFHYSAALLIPFGVLVLAAKRMLRYQVSPVKTFIFLGIIVSFIFLYGFKYVVFNIDALSKFEHYFSSAAGADGQADELGYLRWSLVWIYWFISVYITACVKSRTNIVENTCFAILSSFAAVFTMAEQYILHIFYRVVTYFDIYVCITTVIMVRSFKPYSYRLAMILFIIICGYISVIHMALSGMNMR